MASTSTLSSTVIDYANCRHPAKESMEKESMYISKVSELANIIAGNGIQTFVRHPEPSSEGIVDQDTPSQSHEFKLPSWSSLFIIIGGNAVFQLSFFIVVSSASVYAEHLGGSATFSGLTIGIPAFISGLALIVVTKYDGGLYNRPLNIAYVAMFLGNVLYALAYRADFLYLILIGRIVTGCGFISFMYSKRYCSDPRIVGIRRRTTLAGWLVVGQAFGFSAGPFFGGLLFKVGFANQVFNGVTSPGWIMAVIWMMFWGLHNLIFQDVPLQSPPSQNIELSATTTSEPPKDQVQENQTPKATFRGISLAQWGVIICMCYYAMTCFFMLGSWEANIPVFTAHALGYSPYNAGNFIALGGVASVPFLLLNVWYARRIQDRVILATGTSLGTVGLIIMLTILKTSKVNFGSLFVCWFLVALGFNLASTCTLSLLSKQLPDTWNRKVSMAIQYSNYTGRVAGAILGGSGVRMGMVNYVAVQLAVVGTGGVMYLTLWRQLKAKTG
ncbi:hypothetical protein JR316_0011400 [Psilocybe cubensis]|uniref:Uncharacterized protein n=2 Tax=Psilocybe cubensis TaxID=181762 RepID=A0ACB8GJD8_PSICU|nr:hypothetical protein JR316_0011400 [Psilocybe cubensis]KAH9475840.1 hypothetical protein JR316_0011400 [Psilocybe cubensis]